MGSAPSKTPSKEQVVSRARGHPGNEVGWCDDPEAEAKAALGGLIQVLSSSMGWTWACVVEATEDGIVAQYGERTRMLAWDTPSKVDPLSLEWMDVLR
jgi:hypothetical protein